LKRFSNLKALAGTRLKPGENETKTLLRQSPVEDEMSPEFRRARTVGPNRSIITTMKIISPCYFILTLLSLLSMTAPRLIAQSRKPSGAATLRARFVAAFGKDFDLVKEEMTTRAIERGGGTFWLAFVKPRRTGEFSLQYRYRESGPFEIREHEISFSVGSEKCRRGTPDSRAYQRFCLGDTVIIPVLVNNYSGHEFKLTKAEYTDEKDNPAPAMKVNSLDQAPVDNPAAPTLSYAGRGARRLFHIIPGYTLNLFADFIAQTPGRMNLLVTAAGVVEDLGGYDGVPVIVLPLGTPATLIAGREEVKGYDKPTDREFRTWSSNLFMTNILILQPGDRFTVGYFSVVRSRDYVGDRFDNSAPDPSENLKPLIKVRPFAPDLSYEFTEWIVDYLPK